MTAMMVVMQTSESSTKAHKATQSQSNNDMIFQKHQNTSQVKNQRQVKSMFAFLASTSSYTREPPRSRAPLDR
jgi:hypothetical protein